MFSSGLTYFISAMLSLPATGLQLATPEQLRAVPLASVPYAGVHLPAQVDLSPMMPPPGYQGPQNSCVGWVTAYALKSYQEKLELNHSLENNGRPNYAKIFSPAFIYNQINQRRDGGGSYVDALNVLSQRGAVYWQDMPYRVDDFRSQPTAGLLRKARPFRIDFWRQVNVLDIKELKAHLNAGYPIMIGAVVDEGFYHASKGYVWKSFEGPSRGGHAMLLVGYDDHQHAFKVLNSWGKVWNDQGYGWIDYAYFGKVVHEGFVAKDAWNGLPPPTPKLEPLEKREQAPQDAMRDLKSEVNTENNISMPSPQKPKPASPGAGAIIQEEQKEDARKRRAKLPELGIHKIERHHNKVRVQGWVTLPAHQGYQAHIQVRETRGRTPLGKSTMISLQGLPYRGQWALSIDLKENQNIQELTPILFIDNFGVSQGASYSLIETLHP